MRPSFFNGTWNLREVERHSIFVSQGYYPVKGLHRLIEALPLIVTSFPTAHVSVAGPNPIGKTTLDRARRSSYARLLGQLIGKHGLRDKITFLGVLGEDHYRETILKSHVNVLPSVVENSPNSLCEAMLLGVPSVAAYVGGVPSLVDHGSDGFVFQSDSAVMLSHYVARVFGEDRLADSLSQRARQRARKRHSPEEILERMQQIYEHVAEG